MNSTNPYELAGWFRGWRRRVVEAFNALESRRALHPGDECKVEWDHLKDRMNELPPGGDR